MQISGIFSFVQDPHAMMRITRLHVLQALSAVLVLTGCSKNLDRDAAAEQLTKHLGLEAPQVETVDLTTRDVSAWAPDEKLKHYEQAGLLHQYWGTGNFGGGFSSDFTEEGKKYVTGQPQKRGYGVQVTPVRVCTMEFGSVTGVAEELDPLRGLRVEYELKRTNPTPFFEQANLPQTERYAIYFQKFDDGWRIVEGSKDRL